MTNEKIATLYCANHPTRETYLRCNRCEKPICTSCAVHTPTGYRCKDCVRTQQKIFDTAHPFDYVAAIFIPIILSYLGSLLIGMVGFYTLLIAPGAGWVIAEAVRKATGRRRSKLLFFTAAAASVIGGLGSILPLILVTALGYAEAQMITGLLWPGVYSALVAATVYTRLSGIQITR